LSFVSQSAHDDTLTLDAFLTALSRLGTALPQALQEQLNAIAQRFPESICELPELVDQFEPLEKEYDLALDAIAAHEGERFKFGTPQAAESPTSDTAVAPAPDLLPESTVSWDEVERQVGTYFTEMVLELMEGVKIPNETTRRAFEDTDAGKNLVQCDSVDELFEPLGI